MKTSAEKKPPSTSIWIFLGPSLDTEIAKKTLAAHYHKPIQRGDIEKAIFYGAKVIGIIDGSFYRLYAVSPFEIIQAIQKGIKVFGSSSMGALKAVECSPFGMIGIGKIYEWYQSGKIDAEDEVAIVYNPDNLKAISDPLVNMRYAFQLAVDKKIITLKEKQFLIRIAKKIYFPERNYRSVFLEASKKLFPKNKLYILQKFVKRKKCDLKALDAIACLRSIKKTIKPTQS